jgi:hypothetical protein
MRVAFLVDFFAFHTNKNDREEVGRREKDRARELSREGTLRRNLLFDTNTRIRTHSRNSDLSPIYTYVSTKRPSANATI